MQIPTIPMITLSGSWSANWFLWHGNVHQSLQRIDTLSALIEHDARVPESPVRPKRRPAGR
jgi:hypothetical protein